MTWTNLFKHLSYGVSPPRQLCVAALVLGTCLVACGTSGPTIGTQTNWLRACESDNECGDLRCLCGTCTRGCGDALNCSDLPGASCVSDEDGGAVALCGGSPPPSYGVCLPRCPSEDCPDGSSCIAGVCSPSLEPTARVSVDESQQFQALVAIGAGFSYVVDEVAQHPRKAALLDAMFAESGLTMLRLRNRFGQQGEGDLTTTGEIVSAATERLGRSPEIIVTSSSPPPELKQNDSNWCEGNPETCTLVRLDDGSFDYAGLASHLRASVDAHTAAGVDVSYLSIQNNPNWVPPTGDANEACRFLPAQGTATVMTDAGEVEVEYPGYAEALDAVQSQLSDMSSPPQLVGPDTTNYTQVAEYLAELDPSDVAAIGHHLYGTDTTNLDNAALSALGDLGEQYDRPLFQSEMYTDPLTTAVLMHASFAVEGVAVYLHNVLVASARDIRPDGLINLTSDDFTLGDSYHVIGQYSQHINPGWVRVAADSNTNDLLASAWMSPESDSLVIVLTNSGTTAQTVQLEAPTNAPEPTAVTRTTLAGVERSAKLGALPSGGIVVVPAHSIVTVTFGE